MKNLPGKNNARESKEGTVLRLVREFRKLSLKDVAAKLSCKVAEIDHFENGRKFYTEEDLNKFLACYDLSKEDFAALVNTKVINKIMVNHFLIK
jgi:transcriptional regulator with XRE-family HTH domain